MKKISLVVITLVLLGTSSASAQAVWGARVGLSKPTVSTSEGDAFEGKFGLELGPVLYYSLKDNWYINSGAMFSLKTLSESYSYGGYSATFDTSLMYIDIPLYAGYAFTIGNASLYAQAGPYAGFKLSEKSKWSDSEGNSATSGEAEISGLNFGVGVMAGINFNKFKVELGYQNGLSNILKEKEDNYTVKLNSVFIGVSYVF